MSFRIEPNSCVTRVKLIDVLPCTLPVARFRASSSEQLLRLVQTIAAHAGRAPEQNLLPS